MIMIIIIIIIIIIIVDLSDIPVLRSELVLNKVC